MFRSNFRPLLSRLHLNPLGNIRNLRARPAPRRMPPRGEKRLDVVILGVPNVGKSVLLNCLLEEKLAATSRKRNTTRLEILGVYNNKNIQLAFYDTPGFVPAQGRDSHNLRGLAADSATNADVILLVVDSAQTFTKAYQDIFAEMVKLAISRAKIEVILVLNKVDLIVPKTRLLTTVHQLVSLINGVKLGPERMHEAKLDTTTFMISALQDDGVIDLKNYLLSLAPTRPWLIPKDRGITDMAIEERVEQVVLEQLLDNAHEEIPYVANVECKSVTSLTTSRVKIDVNIDVDTPGQQRILVGHQGRTLVKIRQASVAALEKITKQQVILYLWVNVRGQDQGKQSIALSEDE